MLQSHRHPTMRAFQQQNGPGKRDEPFAVTTFKHGRRLFARVLTEGVSVTLPALVCHHYTAPSRFSGQMNLIPHILVPWSRHRTQTLTQQLTILYRISKTTSTQCLWKPAIAPYRWKTDPLPNLCCLNPFCASMTVCQKLGDLQRAEIHFTQVWGSGSLRPRGCISQRPLHCSIPRQKAEGEENTREQEGAGLAIRTNPLPW